MGGSIAPRRNDTFQKRARQLLSGVGINGAVEHHNAAKGRNIVGIVGATVGGGQAVAHGHAAGVGVLEHGGGRAIARELRNDPPRRFEIH